MLVYGVTRIRENDSYMAVPLGAVPAIDVVRVTPEFLEDLQLQLTARIARNIRIIANSSRDYTGTQRIPPWGIWGGKKDPKTSDAGIC